MRAARIFAALAVFVGLAGAHAVPTKDEVEAAFAKRAAAVVARIPTWMQEGSTAPERRAALEAHDGYAPEGMSGYNSGPLTVPPSVAPNGEDDAMVEHFWSRIGWTGFTCAFIANNDLCGLPMHTAMCPVSCGQALEHFCNGTDNDADMAYYVEDYWISMNETSEAFEEAFADENGDVTCVGAVARYKDTKDYFVHENGNAYSFCEEPLIASLCHSACGTNCGNWPPKKSTQVFMPSCQQTIFVPTSTHLLMRNKKQASGDQGMGCSSSE